MYLRSYRLDGAGGSQFGYTANADVVEAGSVSLLESGIAQTVGTICPSEARAQAHSFIDEKKALAVAQRAFEEAEQKLQNIQSWAPQLEREAYAFRGISQGLMDLVDVEVPNSCALLDRMIDSLESYLALAPEAAAPVAGTESYTDNSATSESVASMARGIDSVQEEPEIDPKEPEEKNPASDLQDKEEKKLATEDTEDTENLR